MQTNSPDMPVMAFAPVLYLINVAAAIAFYKNAFNANELRRRSNDDGSVHVAEMIMGNTLFHLHEEVARERELSPHTLNGTPVVLGLFVANPDDFAARSIAAGAVETSPVQDYDYGYRQVGITDPFGHHWVFQKRI